jgi:hypothetical protein
MGLYKRVIRSRTSRSRVHLQTRNHKEDLKLIDRGIKIRKPLNDQDDRNEIETLNNL